jgi:hypothetical protein
VVRARLLSVLDVYEHNTVTECYRRRKSRWVTTLLFSLVQPPFPVPLLPQLLGVLHDDSFHRPALQVLLYKSSPGVIKQEFWCVSALLCSNKKGQL